ncbi:SDR family NAD(P)-dependent oxidoreductase [Sulfobacillus thermosulfidooxidans]|uniref:SDR family NAD(P)-dependent oxidoreductase n=1 Tax=Sulfobacillus thermosulfidooxidans TaxID=28034 RepID=UPI0006B624BA|nr:SDR family NAD(P)-dependent oxidoreductase [Sulfobacillus thermosulfidooxidans]
MNHYEFSPVALITGTSSGIGRALAQYLIDKHYIVIATARDVDSISDLPAAAHLSLDVTQQVQIDEAAHYVMRQFGRLDVLVNNAAMALRGSIEDVPETMWETIFDVNLMGPVRMIQAFTPYFRQQQRGHIINITTVRSLWGMPFLGTYTASKQALDALTMALSHELAPWGIFVTLVRVGLTKTPLFQRSQQYSEPWITSQSPYWESYQHGQKIFERVVRFAVNPSIIAQHIEKIMASSRPPRILTIPPQARIFDNLLPLFRLIRRLRKA